MLKVGDIVGMGRYLSPRGSLAPAKECVGIVIEVNEPEIYDRCERIVIAWQEGGQSYEKESGLKKLN
jgi:hypothetical protein